MLAQFSNVTVAPTGMAITRGSKPELVSHTCTRSRHRPRAGFDSGSRTTNTTAFVTLARLPPKVSCATIAVSARAAGGARTRVLRIELAQPARPRARAGTTRCTAKRRARAELRSPGLLSTATPARIQLALLDRSAARPAR